MTERNDAEMIAEVEVESAKLSNGPWCVAWLGAGIRHLIRNSDIDCFEEGHKDNGASACIRPDRYDGDVLAIIRNHLPRLIELAEIGLKALESGAVMPEMEKPIKPLRNSCNRHNDCAAAEAAYAERHPEAKQRPANFHCHDETCEDCFGQ